MAGGLSGSPFSGGVWDSWPAWAVDALAICQRELQAIQAFERASEPPKPKRR